MTQKISCSWCHTENPVNRPFCQNCKHEVGKSRMACNCPQCRLKDRQTVEEALAFGESDLLAEALKPLERQAILDALLFTEEQSAVVSDAHFQAKAKIQESLMKHP